MTKQLDIYARIAWEPDDIIEIRPLQLWQGKREWILAKDLGKSLSRMQLENENGANIFAGILPRNKFGYFDNDKINKNGNTGGWRGGESEDVDYGHVIWGDFDHCEPTTATQIISDIGMPQPSMVVATGHGVHVFWR